MTGGPMTTTPEALPDATATLLAEALDSAIDDFIRDLLDIPRMRDRMAAALAGGLAPDGLALESWLRDQSEKAREAADDRNLLRDQRRWHDGYAHAIDAVLTRLGDHPVAPDGLALRDQLLRHVITPEVYHRLTVYDHDDGEPWVSCDAPGCEDGDIILRDHPPTVAPDTLDAAWQAVVDVLPKGWNLRVIHRPDAPEYLHRSIAWAQGPAGVDDGISSASAPQHISGAADLTSALRALAASLRPQASGS